MLQKLSLLAKHAGNPTYRGSMTERILGQTL